MDARQDTAKVDRRAGLWVALLAILLSVLLAACGGSPAPSAPPKPPTDVKVTAVPNGVLVTWADNSTTETGFIVYRAAIEVAATGEPTFVKVATTPKNTERYLDEDVNGNNAYLYQVAATNAAGESPRADQAGSAVSPAPGTDLKLELDGTGVVKVTGGGVDTSCDANCTVVVAAGTKVLLSAAGSAGATFAGWSGDCSQAGTCTVTLDGDAAVTARFRQNVLTVALEGDSPAKVTVSPPDSETNGTTCDLTAGAACAFAYTSILNVSIDVEIPSGSVSDGFDQDCSGNVEFCLVPVQGDTTVRLTVRHPPVAVADSYPWFSGQSRTIPANEGVLANDLDTPDDTLEAYLDEDVKHGNLTLSKDGSFTYASDPGSVANDVFTYHAKDAYGNVSGSVPVTLVIKPATSNIIISGTTQTYDGAPKAVTVTTNPPGLSNTVTYSQGGTVVTNPTDAGDYDVNVQITQDGYTGTETGTLTINPAPLSIKPDNKSKPYDGTTFTAFTATYTGFVNGEDPSDLNGTLTFGGAATTATNAGTYPITASGQTSTNYTITYEAGTLTINAKALTIKADDKSKPYDGQPYPYSNFTATYTGFVNGENASDLGGTLTFGGTATTATNAGTYPITASGQTSTNYTITYEAGTLTINAKALTIKADDKSKPYDGTTFTAFTATYTGFVNGEDPSDLGGTLTFGGAATTATNAGTYPITASGRTSTNYTITYQPGTLTIEPVVVTAPAVVPTASTCDGVAESASCLVHVALIGGTDTYRGAEFDFTSTSFALEESVAGDDIASACLIGSGARRILVACDSDHRFRNGEVARLTVHRYSTEPSSLVITNVALATTALARLVIDGGSLQVQ